MPGAQDRYELLDELGRGTSGEVRRALDRTLGREVAIKLLHAGHTDDAVRRLERESKLAAGFRHPNAVEVYDAGVLDGRPFLAMELMRGPSLAAAMAHARSIAVHVIIEIAQALAEVLAAAHATGLVHRDLKPSNIFIDGTLDAPGRVRLVDFGLAFLIAPTPATIELGRLTADGIIVGTPSYMPPEQVRGETVGPAADIYALGCVLYELATGRTPFVGSLPRILSAQLYLPPLAFAELELARPVPAALEELILELLAKSARMRPAAAEIAAALATLDRAPRRSGSNGATRRERMAPTHDATSATAAADSEIPVRIAIDGDDAALAAELATAGIAVGDRADAEVLVLRLADDGSASPTDATRTIVGIHAAPTPRMIARAIRHGLASVTRWPSAKHEFLARLRAAISPRAASRRIPER